MSAGDHDEGFMMVGDAERHAAIRESPELEGVRVTGRGDLKGGVVDGRVVVIVQGMALERPRVGLREAHSVGVAAAGDTTARESAGCFPDVRLRETGRELPEGFPWIQEVLSNMDDAAIFAHRPDLKAGD